MRNKRKVNKKKDFCYFFSIIFSSCGDLIFLQII